MAYHFWAGGYNESLIGGIQELSLHSDGTLSGIGGYNGVRNPTFLAYDREKGLLFAVSQMEETAELVCFSRDELRLVNRLAFPGFGLCHVGLNSAMGLAGCACYHSGDAAVLSYDGAGLQRVVWHQNFNSGGVQSHPHCMTASPDGRFFYHIDLGRDCVDILACSPGRVQPAGRLQLIQGDGPRQILFHPVLPVAYLVTEYSNVVYVLDHSRLNGALAVRQRMKTLPMDYAETSYAAALARNPATGQIYASNRGADSVAVFDAAADGGLTYFAAAPCGGVWPRHIEVTADGRFLLSANQRSDNLAVLPLGPEGVPGPAVCRVNMKGAAFVMEIPD